MISLTFTVALCLASTSAFAPASTNSVVRTSSSLDAFSAKEEIGAQEPAGYFE